MEVKVNDKVFNVKEILAIDLDNINWDDKKKSLKKEVMLSTGMTEDEYNKLTVKERIVLIHAINDINGLSDFPKPI